MNYREYGCADKETIILLHGGGLSWWSYREVAEKLSSDYHVLLADFFIALFSFSPTKTDASAQQSAIEALIAYNAFASKNAIMFCLDMPQVSL